MRYLVTGGFVMAGVFLAVLGVGVKRHGGWGDPVTWSPDLNPLLIALGAGCLFAALVAWKKIQTEGSVD